MVAGAAKVTVVGCSGLVDFVCRAVAAIHVENGIFVGVGAGHEPGRSHTPFMLRQGFDVRVECDQNLRLKDFAYQTRGCSWSFAPGGCRRQGRPHLTRVAPDPVGFVVTSSYLPRRPQTDCRRCPTRPRRPVLCARRVSVRTPPAIKLSPTASTCSLYGTNPASEVTMEPCQLKLEPPVKIWPQNPLVRFTYRAEPYQHPKSAL